MNINIGVNTKRNIILIVLLGLLMSFVSPQVVWANKGSSKSGKMLDVKIEQDQVSLGNDFNTMEDSTNTILGKVKDAVSFFGGIMLIVFVAIFILLFTKLASVGDNPAKRQEIQTAIMWAFIAAAGLGSVAAIVALAYRFF